MSKVNTLSSDERVAALRPWSTWRKPRSGKVYQVMDTSIFTRTNEVLVNYIRVDDPAAQICSRPIGEFLGDEVISEKDGVKTYAPKFIPIGDDDV